MERRAPVTDTERQKSRKRPDRYANLQEMEKIEDCKKALFSQKLLIRVLSSFETIFVNIFGEAQLGAQLHKLNRSATLMLCD